MHCVKAARLIQAYLDKQLKSKQREALEAHLTVCSTCQRQLQIFTEIDAVLAGIELIAEPTDLTTNVMRHVALSEYQVKRTSQENANCMMPLRPSWQELATVMMLATFAMLGIILGQPSLRTALPIANGYDGFSLFCIHLWDKVISINSGTLMLALWIIGTLLGIWITLTLVGAEMRSAWFHAVLDRLPVW